MNIIRVIYNIDRTIQLLSLLATIILICLVIYYDKVYSQTNNKEDKHKKELLTKILIGFIITFMITFFVFLALRKQNKTHSYGVKKFNKTLDIFASILFMEPDQ